MFRHVSGSVTGAGDRGWLSGAGPAVACRRISDVDGSAVAVVDEGSVSGFSPQSAGAVAPAGSAAGGAAVIARRLLVFEVVVVLAVSFGQSAVISLVDLVGKLTARKSLNQQSAGLNGPHSARPWLDLTYQVLDVGFGFAVVLLVAYLLLREGTSLRVIGFDRAGGRRDWVRGAGVAAVIGGSGLALYVAAHALNLNATVVPTSLPDVWWRVPILVLDAFRNGVTEEVVVLGYLLRRFDQLGWSRWRSDLSSSAIRGSYHLYQGFGGFVGNLVMGLVFCRLYRRWGRVMPLVVAHGLIDTVTFVGWIYIAPHVSWLPH
jgi:membrane protease YdiL (CAAX protease family)